MMGATRVDAQQEHAIMTGLESTGVQHIATFRQSLAQKDTTTVLKRRRLDDWL